MKCPYCHGSGDIESPTLGTMLVAARNNAGLTQQQLSERIGISRAQVANIEGGRSDTSFAILSKIATACGCSLRDLMPETGSAPR